MTELARRALLQAFAPASVLAELNGDILFVHGETGPYLRLVPGQPTHNILDMARDGLQLELRVVGQGGRGRCAVQQRSQPDARRAGRGHGIPFLGDSERPQDQCRAPLTRTGFLQASAKPCAMALTRLNDSKPLRISTSPGPAGVNIGISAPKTGIAYPS